MPQRMPSFFAWRPKIQFRLRKFSRFADENGVGTDDDEDEDGPDEASGGKRSGTRVGRGLDNDDGEIVDSAPRQPQKSPSNFRHNGAASPPPLYFAHPPGVKPNPITNGIGGDGTEQRKRAVRFSEEFVPPPPKPPLSNTSDGFYQCSPTSVPDRSRSPVAFPPPMPPSTAASQRQFTRSPLPPPMFPANDGGGQRSYYTNNNALPPTAVAETSNWLQPRGILLTPTDPPNKVENIVEPPIREFLQPPRPIRSNKTNRANLLLQQLRAGEDAESDTNESAVSHSQHASIPNTATTNDVGTNPRAVGLSLATKGAVYLEFNEETKRSLLPANLRSIDQVKSLFLRSFPNLSADYLHSPNVKIYIQDPSSRRPIFYELEDILEVKDQSMLKVHEQPQTATRPGFHSPPLLPFRNSNNPPIEYLSEPEFDHHHTGRGAWGGGAYTKQPARPASVQPEQSGRRRAAFPLAAAFNDTTINDMNAANSRARQQHQPVDYDTYGNYDPYNYSSDSSSQYARSGSTTPVIDRETRSRMTNMEKQLAGLSSLVHSALLPNKELSGAQREMMDLRRQIMDLREFPGSSLTDSSASTISHNSLNSVEKQRTLQFVQNQLQAIKFDIENLRRQTQRNTQLSEESIHDTISRIKLIFGGSNNGVHAPVHLNSSQHHTQHSADDARMEEAKRSYIKQLGHLQNSLRSFEANIEDIRSSVLNTNRKLRMSEVEELTNSLTDIGKEAANLKVQVPHLQSQVEAVVQRNMEEIVAEESFIREKLPQVDGCLRRCKTLANMMVTMKKLAMIQDPALKLYNGNSRAGYSSKRLPRMVESEMVQIDQDHGRINGEHHKINGYSNEGPVDPEWTKSDEPWRKKQPLIGSNASPHVLDSILDELNANGTNSNGGSRIPTTTSEVSATFTVRIPQQQNKIPERKKYNASEIRMLDRAGGKEIPPPPVPTSNVTRVNNHDENVVDSFIKNGRI